MGHKWSFVQSQSLNSLEQSGRAGGWESRGNDDGFAAVRRYGGTRAQGGRSIIPAFDIHIRLPALDQRERAILLENGDAIGGFERRYYKRTLIPGIERAQWILVTPDGFIAIDGDQQAVAARLRQGQVVRMAGMHDVERAARESNLASRSALGLDPGIDLRCRAYLIRDGHRCMSRSRS